MEGNDWLMLELMLVWLAGSSIDERQYAPGLAVVYCITLTESG